MSGASQRTIYNGKRPLRGMSNKNGKEFHQPNCTVTTHSKHGLTTTNKNQAHVVPASFSILASGAAIPKFQKKHWAHGNKNESVEEKKSLQNKIVFKFFKYDQNERLLAKATYCTRLRCANVNDGIHTGLRVTCTSERTKLTRRLQCTVCRF